MMLLALWVVFEGSNVERPKPLTKAVGRHQRLSKLFPSVYYGGRRFGMSQGSPRDTIMLAIDDVWACGVDPVNV